MVDSMSSSKDLEALQKYIERTRRILELSSPQLDGIDGAEAYRRTLLSSFAEIGLLAKENNKALAAHFYPLLADDRSPGETDMDTLRRFSSLLLDTTSMENLDHPLILLAAGRLLKTADSARENRADPGNPAETPDDAREVRAQILALDGMIIAAYMMLNLTLRLAPEYTVCYEYRDMGIAAGKRLMEYLPPERFETLPDDECRSLVLINARYIRCLFEWDDQKDMEAVNARDLFLMRRALDIANDPYYPERMPAYRWDAHIFRTLQYLADFTEYHNKHGFSPLQLKELYGYTKELVSFLHTHPALAEGCPQIEQDFYLLRNSFFAGEITRSALQDGLLRLMEQRDRHDYTARSMFVNFIIPFEFLLTLDGGNLSAEEAAHVREIYADIVAYAYHMPKTGVLSFMLTFLSEVLKHFIEVPGGMDFETMCLHLLAAMHPPTYVHTLSVASFTRFLTACLIDEKPALFIGVAGTKTAEEVAARAAEITDFAYHAALFHDIGKLFIVETIITYGRDLLDIEYEMIKAHPTVGASLLTRFESTRRFADAAHGHHKWYNNLRGYPEDFDLDASPDKTVIAILTASDCLDAATDAIGRSYKKGKTLEEFIGELKEGSGTHYAPFLPALFDRPDVREGLLKMLTDGRNENYRKAYRALKLVSAAGTESPVNHE